MTVTSVTAVAVSFRSVSTTSPGAEAAETRPAGSSRTAAAERRADTLLTRLDTDQDGAVSKDEFTSGAIELLRRASARAYHRHVGREDGDGDDRREDRWRARLERVFDRIDGNGDGAVDRGELSARMQPKARPGRRPEHGCESSCPPPAATTVTSVTLVAVAIRRYTVDAAPATPTPGSTAPASQAPAAAPASEPLAR
jgi:hypothetical protein